DLSEVLSGHPPAIQNKLAEYASAQRAKLRAAIFVTDDISVHRSPNGHQTADIQGDRKRIPIFGGRAAVPVTAMMVNLAAGPNQIVFELKDEGGALVATQTKPLRVSKKQRVTFSTATFDLMPKVDGRYDIEVKRSGTTIGDTHIHLEVPGHDEQLIEDEEDEAL